MVSSLDIYLCMSGQSYLCKNQLTIVTGLVDDYTVGNLDGLPIRKLQGIPGHYLQLLRQIAKLVFNQAILLPICV